MINIFTFILLLLLIVISFATIRSKDLLSSVVLFGAYSLMMSIIWLSLRAPDVAITEAVIGIIITVMFIALISKTRRSEK
ncbi:MAG: DUF4040 domain-containing protein [Halanaerobiales bacterium]|nr:DUF4040 domain-containing protein [Halanaerobiales bacterium]